MTIPLMAIWWTSLAISAATLAVLAILVLRRLIAALVGRRRFRRQEGMLSALQAAARESGPIRIPKVESGWEISDMTCAFALRAMNSVPRRWRTRMADLLKELGLDRGIAETLSDGGEDEQAEAVEVLRLIDGYDYAKALRALVVKSAWRLRIAGVQLLLDWQAVPSVEWLLRVLEVGEGPPSFEVVALFRRLNAPKAYWIREIFDSHSPTGVKIIGIYTLAHDDGTEEREAVVKMLNHESPDVRAQTIRVLGLLQAPELRPWLGRLLRDKVWFVRAQAAFACGRVGAEEYVPRLLLSLNSEQWWERYRAALALYRLNERGRQALRDAIPFAGRAGRTASIVLSERGVAT